MRKILFLIGFLICVNFAYTQDPTATLQIGTLYEPSLGLVNVPITLEAINNPILGNNLVSSWGWYVIYNADVLGDAVNFVNINPAFPSANYLFNVVQDVPAVGWNSIAIIYAAAISTNATPGMQILEMQFNYAGGTSTIDWGCLGGFCTNMADDEGNEFVLTLINGCVCLNTFDVTFHVTDNQTGNDLAGAQVTVGSQSVLTNAQGIAVFNLVNGNYSYTVSATGYTNKTGNFTVNGANLNIPVAMNIIGAEFDVTFQVTSGGNPLQGATVTVGSESVVTNALGEAVIALADGNYNYSVSKYGYTTQTGNFVVAGAALNIPVSLPALPQYNITFHVTSGGNNVEGASIVIPDVGVMVTDIGGNAVFSLIDGTYNYTISKTGYAVKNGSVTVAGSAFTVEETLLALYQVTVHVTSGGANLSGAAVTIGTQTLVTNASGNAIFQLTDGSYSYSVTKSGYTPEAGNFTVAGANLLVEVIMLPIEYVVTFHVTSGGNNLQGVLVEVNTLSATTDAGGNATLSLSNGDYVYTASKEGYYIEQDAFTVAGGPLLLEVVMIALPVYPVTFHVTSGGSNLQGADVTIGTQTIPTDANGNAVFNLTNGTYNYLVEKIGYVTQTGTVDVVNSPVLKEIIMPLFEWTITFHVTSGGANVTGATVTVNPGNLTALTGPNGNATFNLGNGNYTYEVSKTGYITQNGDLVVNNANQTKEVDLPFGGWETKFHCIVGGVGLAGVDVTCNGETKTTDANGDAIFFLQNGTYDYTASKFCYNTVTGTVTVNNANQTKNVLMTLQPYAVTFVVTHNAEPIPGASVTLAGVTQLTGDDGTTVFMKVNGTYNYSVTHPDYGGPVTGTVTVNCAPVTETIQLVGVYDITSGSFNVYPNPSNGTFSITTTAIMGYESNVTVYDLAGKPVYTGKLEGNDVNVIDLSGNGKGMYIMQIIVEGKVYNKTLVIQ